MKGLDGVISDFIAKQVVKSCENKYSKSASNESVVPEKPKSTTIEVGSSKKWKIPLPAGEYVKTGSRTHYGNSAPQVYEIYEHIEDGKLRYLLYVSYTKSQNPKKWSASKTCNRKNLHFIKKNNESRRWKTRVLPCKPLAYYWREFQKKPQRRLE